MARQGDDPSDTDALAALATSGRFGDFVTAAAFRRPSNIFDSTWVEHAPFAFWLVDVLRPRTLVELGVWTGFSFLAFCDAVDASGLDTRCVGIDTWEGDAHAGTLSPDVADVVAARAARYGDAAELVRSTFDSAAPRFPPQSIDLLHLDGLHTYEAVRHDVDTWIGGLSERGVLLLHDSQVAGRGFGVARVVDELRRDHPVFSFEHGFGLAVVGVGPDLPAPLARLVSLDERSEEARAVGAAYARLGAGISDRLRFEASLRRLTHVHSERERLALETDVLALELAAARRPLGALRSPTGRLACRARKGASRLSGAATSAGRQARRLSRVAWWTVTLRLPRRLAERRRELAAARESPGDDYSWWVASYDTLTPEDHRGMTRLVDRLRGRPLVSLLLPVHDPPLQALRDVVGSVVAQAYPDWELVVADDASEDPAIVRALDELAAQDDRIVVVRRERCGGASAASNSALAAAGGELCGLLDHGVRLRPHALLLTVERFAGESGLALVYADEDRLDDAGRRVDPYFKPDWSPALLESQNYLGRFTVFRTELARRVGALRSAYDGAQDWDLAFRLTEEIEPEQIGHVPHVLHHVAARDDAGGGAAGREAIVDHLARRGRVGVVTESGARPRVRVLPREPLPHVTVIVPTTARPDLVDATLDGLLHGTRYPPLDIVVAVHRSVLADDGRAARLLLAADVPSVQLHVHDLDPFDYARVNNGAAASAVGSYVLFLNDDIEVLDADWLETLVGQVQSEGVGAVGAFLVYPDRTIQQAGIMLAAGGPSHAYVGRPATLDGYHGRLQMAHDVSAVTGACLLVSKDAFDAVGGFDPRFAVAYNDVDLCLRLREHGHRVVFAPLARLVHVEGASFGSHYDGRVSEWNAERDLFHERWGALMGADRFHNPNLADKPARPEKLAFPPRVTYPWRYAENESG